MKENRQNTDRILLVDDETLFVRAACKLLERAGYQTTGCYTLNDAREALQQDRFDLVVLDVRLPDGSGLSLLEDLAQQAGSPP
ncbi:MAG: response regulator, partial [Gammaproteobacteria bacterium]|nr:response regulator [Gammaproteobacteria bacterium]